MLSSGFLVRKNFYVSKTDNRVQHDEKEEVS